MKKVLFFCVLVVLALCMAACGGAPTNEENNEQIVENQENNNQENNTEDVSNEEAVTIETLGTIYVGIDGAYPPYCFLNENDEVDGFEVAIMNEIAARNDIEIVCQITSWTSMFGQLDSGRIDTVAEAISKTPEREETYIFSKSYVENSNRFLVRGGEESSIESFEDLEGKKIGVASGQAAYDELLAIQEEYNVSFEIVPYETSTNCYDVSIGRIDASYMNPVAGMSMSMEGDMGLAVADCPAYVFDVCAYPFVKDSPRAELLCQIFSDTLTEMEEDGTLSQLCIEWLGSDIAIVE